jgi:hypothetical protein
LLRGDSGFGNEPIMREAKQRGLAYLFKLRLTAKVKRMIERLSSQSEWTNAGHGWQAKECCVSMGGEAAPGDRVAAADEEGLAVSSNNDTGQQQLSFVDVDGAPKSTNILC